MRRQTMAVVAAAILGCGGPLSGGALAHCQIPCGIYDDAARIASLEEHITTIEKSMREITKLATAAKPDHNQLVRWVRNKEDHAAKINEIVTGYFMAQRVKPADPADKEAYARYTQQVVLLHQVLVNAMQAKQTVDLACTARLRGLVKDFARVYGLPTQP